ncbi:MAG: succinate dehydrogenase, hydrophobic membrane anchor protein [Rhodospirillaceae bacterium]|nr:MAG: succinate dehydrogenase, hydrophobic membrane anchor protein [Rhodospirillaceae bacterium]
MTMRTPLRQARGLGSAKEGVGHWWAQRVTAIALVPLTLWFVTSLLSLIGADHAAVLAWVGSPVAAVLLILLLATSFYHAQLGLQVVFEDYIHHKGRKLAAILFVKFACLLLGVATVFSVLKIAFQG